MKHVFKDAAPDQTLRVEEGEAKVRHVKETRFSSKQTMSCENVDQGEGWHYLHIETFLTYCYVPVNIIYI